MSTATLVSRITRSIVGVFLLAIAGFAVPSASAQTGHPKLSPFEMVRWNELAPEVLVGGVWWRLDAIDGIRAETIAADAQRMFGEDWPKRFCEDLVEVLVRSGHTPSATAVLRLTDLEDLTRTVEREAVWSAENRRRIRNARPRPGVDVMRSSAVPRIERERATEVDPRFDVLTRRLAVFEASADRLTRDQAAQDLAQLEWLVENVYAYKDRVGFEYRDAFDALHARLGESIARASFALQIQRLLCEFGDGHTRVRTATAELLLPGALPVALVRDRHGVVALSAGGSSFDTRHPYLVAIDGEPIAVWLDAAATLVPRGSSAFEARGALKRVVHVPHLRAERGLQSASKARLTLADAAGSTVEREVEFVPMPVSTREGERLAARRLDGDIGYLRIGRMDDDAEFLAQLGRHLDALTGVRGLVVDVRGNGGGSRHPLLAIAPRVVPRSVGAVVVNVAALRLAPGEDARTAGSALSDRFLYPAANSAWSQRARESVKRADEIFRAHVELPANEFTGWHYLVLESDAERAPITSGPVAVLQDEGCFSATDIFLGALGELPNVTLVGTASGGGSGRARGHVLRNSGIGVQLSTMASFLPNGSPYDGRGIEPDVRVEPTLDDRLGRTDSALERALEWVREK